MQKKLLLILIVKSALLGAFEPNWGVMRKDYIVSWQFWLEWWKVEILLLTKSRFSKNIPINPGTKFYKIRNTCTSNHITLAPTI